jgi:hypothetical protein
MPRFDLTKPKPTVIMIEEGDESSLAREGKRLGYLLSQVRHGLWRPNPWGRSSEFAEFLEAMAKGMEAEEAAFSERARLELVAAQLAELKEKRTKIIHEIRALDPPQSPTDKRLLKPSALEYTFEFPRSERSIRDHLEEIDERGVHHTWQPKTLGHCHNGEPGCRAH